MAFTPIDLVYAVLTGASVVAVTLLGDRLGGRIGGLVATAPVTTTAAHVVIATSVAPEQAAERILHGVNALLGSTFGIVGFFYTVKHTRGRDTRIRLAAGLAAFLALFVSLTLLFARTGLPLVSGWAVLFMIHLAFAFSFMREPIPVLKDYVPRKVPRTAREFGGRFLAGALVVLAIRQLVDVAPILAGALAVVPAVFVVSLTVMGIRQNAPFAARAAQAGLFGTTAVAVFVLVIAAGLSVGLHVWATIPFAWIAYGASLMVLGNVHNRIAR